MQIQEPVRHGGLGQDLATRIVNDGKLFTERQAKEMLRPRAEAAARGLEAKISFIDVIEPENASMWIGTIKKKCRECQDVAG